MTLRLRSLGFVLTTPLVLASCLSSHVSPDPSLDVEASIASVTLGDDCGSAARPGEPGLWAGDCAEDHPCGFCQQTAVHVSLDAADDGAPVPVEVVSVRLLTMDGAFVGALEPRAGRLFVDGAYVDWDTLIAPGESLHVTYDTSAPDWTAIGGGDSFRTHGMQFRVEMVVRIDGVERTLEFAPAMREAEIVT